MFYPFLTLNDNTEIVHSEAIKRMDGNKSRFALKNPFMEVSILLPAGFLIIDGKISTVFPKKRSNIFKNISPPLRTSSCNSPVKVALKEVWTMPRVFKIGSYIIYFWVNENDPLDI